MTSSQLSTVDDSEVLNSDEMMYLLRYLVANDAKRSKMSGTFPFVSRLRLPAITQQDEDDEGEDVDQTNTDIDFEYGIIKPRIAATVHLPQCSATH